MAARHRFLFLLAALALLASACGSSSNSSEEEATPQTAPPEAVGVVTTGGAAQATTTTGARKEPTGKVVYGWHTALTPAWLDPQDAGNVITAYGFMYALHDSMIKHYPVLD